MTSQEADCRIPASHFPRHRYSCVHTGIDVQLCHAHAKRSYKRFQTITQKSTVASANYGYARADARAVGLTAVVDIVEGEPCSAQFDAQWLPQDHIPPSVVSPERGAE